LPFDLDQAAKASDNETGAGAENSQGTNWQFSGQ